MLKTVGTILVALLSIALYYVLDLIAKRWALRGLPQPPMKNLLVGHLHIADEVQRLFPKGVHVHCMADYIRTKYNLPEVFYVDWRPFGDLFVFVADPALAATYVTTVQSLPKSRGERSYLKMFLGDNNLITLEGAHWKSLRTLFNPGFSATNVMTFVDYAVDNTMEFIGILQNFAKTNEIFKMEEWTTRLTINLIGKVTFDADLDCLKDLDPIAKHFLDRTVIAGDPAATFPWDDFDAFRPLKLWWNARNLDKAIDQKLNDKIVRRARDLADTNAVAGKRKLSVIDLALDSYERRGPELDSANGQKHMSSTRIANVSQLPPEIRGDLVSSIKTFFFAGHDTTSTVIANAVYFLHRYPAVHVKVVEELDRIYPRGIADTAAAIKTDPYSLNKLEYMTAVVKESMRILTPASTSRMINTTISKPAHSAITDPKTGAKYPMHLPGSTIWPVAYLIHRNPRFFPEPTQFIPERFIQNLTPFPFPESELFTPAGREAFRGFERGPRNCIGQELAMVEIKTVLALIVRNFDFVLEYPGEKPDPQFPIPKSTAEEFDPGTEYGRAIRAGADRNRVEGHRNWQTLAGTAKPTEGAPGRIYLRQ